LTIRSNLAAASGASTRELMHRMGHGSMHAALIYQHAMGERDREIADALQLRIERELKEMEPIEGSGLGVDGSSLGLAPRKREMTRWFCCGAGDENRTRMTSLEDAPSGPLARLLSLCTWKVVTARRRE
jgi:hypothetical protein